MAKGKKKVKLGDLPGLADPRAPIDGAMFLGAAQAVLKTLEADLAARASESAAVTAALSKRHAEEKAQGRTADGFAAWKTALITQVAAAWVLSCVFARVLEDRGLLGHARIAGPGAEDSQKQFFEIAPSLTERDYLLVVFRELSRLPGLRDVFDARHNPVWKLAPSAEAARELLGLFRRPSATEPAFRFGQPSTRFLGDLYQDLSEAVRKKYALLQTPDFIESFILDRTLERAIERFGLEDTDLIDPTCGSGHFLLGAFDRLYEHRLRAQPGLDPREAARLALDKVYGADINPYAVAIARFRLTLAFIDKAGYKTLADVPELPLHVVVADSLLHNKDASAQGDFKDLEGQSAQAWAGEDFALEDEQAARDVLHRQYAAVVGNPPYITVKDKALRDRYRPMYTSCHREYSLAAPFCERFFQLGRERGFTGQITANSFMKREFGKKLIEEFLPTVNLHVIANTSGAYIPGHGTPTVLLFGTAEEPQDDQVLSVLAKRGEPSTPAEPERGEVWSSISKHWSEVGFENDFISISKTPRDALSKHPWSLAGGGAVELKALLEKRAEKTLGEITEAIGFSVITGEDNCLVAPLSALTRGGIAEQHARRLVIGEDVRDWAIGAGDHTIWPNDEFGERLDEDEIVDVLKYLWPYQTALRARKAFGVPVEKKGIPWWALREVYSARMKTPLTITFAFVATHNHFVLDRGGKVFNRTAPIIKLPESATEDDHLALLAYLNSSTACFWMKQVLHDKGSGTDAGKWQDDPAKIAFEFAGTPLKELPIPRFTDEQRSKLTSFATTSSKLSARRSKLLDELVNSVDAAADVSAKLVQTRAEDLSLLGELVAIQEELDWVVYAAFGLADDSSSTLASVKLGERPFEIREARAGSKLGTDGQILAAQIPPEWPSATKICWEDRLAAISESKELQTIEAPDYKRRWLITPKHLAGRVQTFEDRLSDALDSAFAQQVEKVVRSEVTPVRRSEWLNRLPHSSAQLSQLRRIEREVYLDRMLELFSVPFLATLRFKPSGLKKHALWRSAWNQERSGLDSSVPPKFGKGDFETHALWELRGKLDVPKERFISYPGCESDEDGEPVYGWAGWDHLQRAQALATLYQKRKTEEGWPTERLIPMLAGLYELLPWLLQWHNDKPDPTYGEKMGDFFERFIEAERNAHALSKDQITTWRPPAKAKRPASKKAKKASAKNK